METVDHDSKIVVVKKIPDSSPERFNSTQLKPFRTPIEASSSFMAILYQLFSVHATKNTGGPSESPNILRSSASNTHGIHATEIIDINDPRASCPEMRETILEEVRELLQRGTFQVVMKDELLDGANALTTRLVLA